MGMVVLSFRCSADPFRLRAKRFGETSTKLEERSRVGSASASILTRQLEHPQRGRRIWWIQNFRHEIRERPCLRTAIADGDGDVLPSIHHVADRRCIWHVV